MRRSMMRLRKLGLTPTTPAASSSSPSTVGVNWLGKPDDGGDDDDDDEAAAEQTPSS